LARQKAKGLVFDRRLGTWFKKSSGMGIHHKKGSGITVFPSSGGGGGGGMFNKAAAEAAERNWQMAMKLLEDARNALGNSPLYKQAEALMLAMMSGETQPYDAATQANIYGGISDMLTTAMQEQIGVGEAAMGVSGLRGGSPASFKAGKMSERADTLARASAQERGRMEEANFKAMQQAMAQGTGVAAQKAAQEAAINQQMAQMYATRQYPAYV